jgi:hypothetical protein
MQLINFRYPTSFADDNGFAYFCQNKSRASLSKLKHCFNVAQDEVANPEIKIFDERLS